MADQPYQSLYRRYRPQRFGQVRGQEHITRGLTNAVRDDKVSHAYLFSGPRGTGKTTTARILAKALNCTNVVDGEPCDACESCTQIRDGASLDVYELDAASNNGVDAMRDLVSRAALGTPGRTKVYIVDEVHMLSTAASNALLKTLEEPPGHVVFVLATTDPQKVLPTIRSRTQHFEFRLLGSDVLGDLLRDINADAGLGVPVEAIDMVATRGHGSARDALSVLDQVAAAGHVEDEASVVDDMVEALCDHDVGRALAAVADGCAAGRDPRRLAEELLAHLRNNFLAIMARSTLSLSDDAADRAEEQGRRLGPAALVRAMEAAGDALMQMREALDPRVSLEVALVRVARPEVDVSMAALVERVERLERGTVDRTAEPTSAPAPAEEPPARTASPKPALGALKKQAAPKAEAPKAEPPPAPAPKAAKAGVLPSRDDLTTAWADAILPKLSRKVAVWFKGRFAGVDTEAVFAVEDANFLQRADKYKSEVEAALADHFGVRVPLRLTVDEGVATAPVAADDHDEPDFDSPAAAPPATSPEEHVKMAFPGAEEVTDE
ncbi:MAG TPA: DNA polymerase III subunit gamma/tau [Acidimicrobiales bacterium]|nr:DNA polymerase III subunit gamma/tau [Acidimicrobiales bacterium]